MAQPEAECAAPIAAPIAPPTVALEPPKAAGVGFRNPKAVRVGMLVAAMVTLLQAVPFPPVVQPIWLMILLLGGGFISVYLYHRRTGDAVSVLAGARLGWMTGVFVFLVILVLFTITAVLFGSQPALRDALARSGPQESVENFRAVLSNPAMMMAMLAFGFFLVTIIPSAGGALAAKVLQKD